jgi:hypothetical protein
VARINWPGFAFGGDELRLIGLGLLYIVASIVVWLLVALLFGAIIAALAFGSPGAAGIVGIVLGIICFCAAVWLSVRLSLVGAVFVLERRFALRKGWQASKSHFWTLFGTYLIMAIVFLVVEVIIISVVSPGSIGSTFSGDPQQALERQQQMMATFNSPSLGLIALWVVGTILGTAVFVYYVASSLPQRSRARAIPARIWRNSRATSNNDWRTGARGQAAACSSSTSPSSMPSQ